MIPVGQKAPEIDLETQFGNRWKLSERLGKKNVLILFYPMDWTPICTSELPEVNRMLQDFAKADTEVVACSCDSKPSHQRWAESLGGIAFPMLCDCWPKGATSGTYGSFLPDQGISDRASVIVGKDGTVKYSQSVGTLGRRDFPQILKASQDVNQGIVPAECGVMKGVLYQGLQYPEGLPPQEACQYNPAYQKPLEPIPPPFTDTPPPPSTKRLANGFPTPGRTNGRTQNTQKRPETTPQPQPSPQPSSSPDPENAYTQAPGEGACGVKRLKAAAEAIVIADATLYLSNACGHCNAVRNALARMSGPAKVLQKEITDPSVKQELYSLGVSSVPALILRDGSQHIGRENVMVQLRKLLPKST